MKIISCLLLYAKLCAPLFAQPFLILGMTNRGVEVSIGGMSRDGGFETTLAYKLPMSRVDRPKILSVTIGRQLLITGYEMNNYSVTPTIGYGYLQWKEFSAYNALVNPALTSPDGPIGGPLPVGSDGILTLTEFKPIIGLELGKDAYMGRFGLVVNWCKFFYYGINFRIFPYRNMRS